MKGDDVIIEDQHITANISKAYIYYRLYSYLNIKESIDTRSLVAAFHASNVINHTALIKWYNRII